MTLTAKEKAKELVDRFIPHTNSDWDIEIEQAKQMEKEQIIKAYDESNKRLCLQCTDFKTGIKYYNETYKNETK